MKSEVANYRSSPDKFLSCPGHPVVALNHPAGKPCDLTSAAWYRTTLVIRRALHLRVRGSAAVTEPKLAVLDQKCKRRNRQVYPVKDSAAKERVQAENRATVEKFGQFHVGLPEQIEQKQRLLQQLNNSDNMKNTRRKQKKTQWCARSAVMLKIIARDYLYLRGSGLFARTSRPGV